MHEILVSFLQNLFLFVQFDMLRALQRAIFKVLSHSASKTNWVIVLEPFSSNNFSSLERPQSWSKLHKLLRNCFFFKAYMSNFPKYLRWKKLFWKFFTLLWQFHANHQISWEYEMGLSGWFDILIASILIRGYYLLSPIKLWCLMIASIDIFHHASLPRSREKLTLHQFSPDFLVHWSINYVDKGIPAKDWRDGGCCSDGCMRKGKRLWEWLYRLVRRWT